MSLINDFNDEISEPKDDIFISPNGISDNHYIPLKVFKEDLFDNKSSSSGNSSINKIINNQFIKEMTDKNIISDACDSYCNDDNNTPITQKNSKIINFENLQSFSEGEKESKDSRKYIYDSDNMDMDYNNHDLSFNLNSNLSFSLSSDEIYYCNNNNNINDISNDEKSPFNENSNNKKKIFKVIRMPGRIGLNDMKYLKKKRRPRKRGKNKTKNSDIDWDNIPVTKEKHFHLDRKKKRIIFQRKYLKMLYSIVDLEYPFNFLELFELIKKHVGDKTATNYGNGKSFHIIKIDDKLIIVTMKEKKIILKSKKNLDCSKDCTSTK